MTHPPFRSGGEWTWLPHSFWVHTYVLRGDLKYFLGAHRWPVPRMSTLGKVGVLAIKAAALAEAVGKVL